MSDRAISRYRFTTSRFILLLVVAIFFYPFEIKAQTTSLTHERTIEGSYASKGMLLNLVRSSSDCLDLNGDGIPEQIFLGSDSDRLRIVDGSGSSRELILLDGTTGNIFSKQNFVVVGCYNGDGIVDGSDFSTLTKPKEIVVGEISGGVDGYGQKIITNVHVASAITSNMDVWEWRRLGIIGILVAIVDIDDDGKQEFLISEPADGSEGSTDKILVYGFN